jgi:uncharacterized RDD family membrane protein YckC
MSTDSLIVTSPTGVDVELAIAGPGSRAYAFIIDWHIRLLGALCWFAVVTVLVPVVVNIRWKSPATAIAIATLPASFIYLLYHPLLEWAMRGRTPGKRMAGVRLIARGGGAPSAGALLMRNVFRLIDCMPIFYLVGLIGTLISSQHLRIGDLAAGTLLVFDQDRNVKSLTQLGTFAAQSKLDAAALDLLNDLLARWDELDADHRRALATTLLMRLDAQARELPASALTEETVKSRLLALLKSGASIR